MVIKSQTGNYLAKRIASQYGTAMIATPKDIKRLQKDCEVCRSS